MASKKLRIIQEYLSFLYGEKTGQNCFSRLERMLEKYLQTSEHSTVENAPLFDVRDVILITYGDILKARHTPSLETLYDFHQQYLANTINIVHILPFFPYSSDDGFSVIDYKAVDPGKGSWEDIARFSSRGVKLMFDAVINHISAESAWFQGYLAGDEKYQRYFIEVDPGTDLSAVTRPRALPLLTSVETNRGTKQVWTTFSADQIDLNYQNPETLLDVLSVLLYYVEQGAKLIRLDAIAYLWKELGTSCIHLPQTHAIVQLMRAVIDAVAPNVLLITETNVPHEENLSYFGDGSNEAHMVYQFSLPPLTAHALLTGSAVYLTQWASGLQPRTDTTTFMNFTASHDGVGVRPASGILPKEDVDLLASRTLAHGGRISSKTNADGSTSPYELNITYFDLINDPKADEPMAIQVKRFLVSQAILLAMAGIPGIYIHSLLGSRNFNRGVEATGQPRTINREKLDLAQVTAELEDDTSLRHAVFEGYQHLIQQRVTHQAFHPNGEQRVLDLHDAVFSLMRVSPDGGEKILALHNVSQEAQRVFVDQAAAGLKGKGRFLDVLTGKSIEVEDDISIELAPYQVSWMQWLPGECTSLDFA